MRGRRANQLAQLESNQHVQQILRAIMYIRCVSQQKDALSNIKELVMDPNNFSIQRAIIEEVHHQNILQQGREIQYAQERLQHGDEVASLRQENHELHSRVQQLLADNGDLQERIKTLSLQVIEYQQLCINSTDADQRQAEHTLARASQNIPFNILAGCTSLARILGVEEGQGDLETMLKSAQEVCRDLIQRETLAQAQLKLQAEEANEVGASIQRCLKHIGLDRHAIAARDAAIILEQQLQHFIDTISNAKNKGEALECKSTPSGAGTRQLEDRTEANNSAHDKCDTDITSNKCVHLEEENRALRKQMTSLIAQLDAARTRESELLQQIDACANGVKQSREELQAAGYGAPWSPPTSASGNDKAKLGQLQEQLQDNITLWQHKEDEAAGIKIQIETRLKYTAEMIEQLRDQMSALVHDQTQQLQSIAQESEVAHDLQQLLLSAGGAK